jgi:peptide/nickel transport system substrate-binding protein
MKHIVWTFLAGNRRPARFAALVALAAMATNSGLAASTRPQFGGTLRVQMSERIDNLDPRQWPSETARAAAAERLDSLVFDRLVLLDEHGAPQPALAISWQHDAPAKRWEFRLRDGVKFSDGTPLTPPIAAMALQQLLGLSFDVSATADSVVIQADQFAPDLPTRLAGGRYFIFRDGDNASLTGTGPFVFTQFESMGRAAQSTFIANESCWAGRPFVDKISVLMNAESEQQANGIAFGQADVVDLSASQVRRAAQRGVRTVSSDPIELFALVFPGDRPAVQDARVRQAISLAIDRPSIADVILQRQGVVAGGLLPNWISGYAQLFSAPFDVPRAKALLAAAGHQLSRPGPLELVYDSGDADARAVADRVAVNLREVGIVVQVSGQTTDGKKKAASVDLRLLRHRIAAPDPAAALLELLPALGESATNLETIEEDYDAERGPVEAFRVIPLVHVSESYGLGPQVRDWMAPRWGGWDLADVWLGPPSTTGGGNP